MLSDRPPSPVHDRRRHWPHPFAEPSRPANAEVEDRLRGDVLAMVVDEDGRLTYLNSEALRLGHWTWPEVAGHLWWEVILPVAGRDIVRRRMRKAVTSDATLYVETPFVGGDGLPRTIAWAANRSTDGDGQIIGVTSVGVDVTRWTEERDAVVAQRRYDADHDLLTGLASAEAFVLMLEEALVGVEHGRKRVGILLVNVDRFRVITETIGREGGDRLLRLVADRVREHVRDAGVTGRWSGHEFAILIEADSDSSHPVALAQRVVEAMRVPFLSGTAEFHLGASIGIVSAPEDGLDASRLMRHASMAMSHAKRAGGARHSLFRASLSEDARERMVVEHELRGALARHEISVAFQAQVDAASHRIIGVEALARWNHPALGSVAPSHFIPIAEETGMIAELGLFVLRAALVSASEWREAGLRPITVAVNLSVHQLAEATLVDDVRAILDETGTPPYLLELEVTESAVMADMESAAQVLRELAAMGVAISLDDFGTGFSCLSHLNFLHVGTIKIDRTFLVTSPVVADANALVRGLVLLARSLNLRVVAEGVETREQLTRLEPEGCDVYQGFLFSRPVSGVAMQRLLERGIVLT